MQFLEALCKEIELRKNEIPNTYISTVYFGGGTPSLLTIDEIKQILETLKTHFQIEQTAEITFEINPENATKEYLEDLKRLGINRLSVGIQSFNNARLKEMNRIHNSEKALHSLTLIQSIFSNFSVDLIYGNPNQSTATWKADLKQALSFDPPHLSLYALTVEPKTALFKKVSSKKVSLLNDDEVAQQFAIAVQTLKEVGYDHYEISNFGKPNYHSQHNSSYWQGKPYMGLGPSAHSFDGENRKWNCSNNALYIKSLAKNTLPSETENLSQTDKFNEIIMTGLRTSKGISLSKIKQSFPPKYTKYLLEELTKNKFKKHLTIENEHILLNENSRFLADGLASDLFIVD